MLTKEKEDELKAILILVDKTYSKEIIWSESDRHVLPKDLARVVRECYEGHYLNNDMLLYSISVYQDIDWRSGDYDFPEVLKEVVLVSVDENSNIIEQYESTDVRVLINLMRAVQKQIYPSPSSNIQNGHSNLIDSILENNSV